MKDIQISDFSYVLPETRIAQYPADKRDDSCLLLYDGINIKSDIFRNIGQYIKKGSLLVFNDTKVIRARLLFQKPSGARVEILCLEPIQPASYESSFSSVHPVYWKCIVGNLKKWKSGPLSMKFFYNGREHELKAEKAGTIGEAWKILFSWTRTGLTFGEVVESAGHLPLPPYINREDEETDYDRYQTIYSSVNGSVAAPTAGLHFTEGLMEELARKGIENTRVTLHVGAGTFQPVRNEDISRHVMHTEHFFVTRDTVAKLAEKEGAIVAVGTTTVRTIESLYWLGVKLVENPGIKFRNLRLDQWEPYSMDRQISAREALGTLLDSMLKNKVESLSASTQVMIVPGYRFRITNAMITNFHQPRSSLLLLVAAWTGAAWKDIYKYALENGFRFLSYGDSSFLYNGPQ